MIGAVTGDKLANPGGSTSLNKHPQELARRPEMRLAPFLTTIRYRVPGDTYRVDTTTTTRQHTRVSFWWV